METHSFYMRDDSTKDGKIEAIMDYTISWTLRRAQKNFKEDNIILYNYSRNILAKLLDISVDDSIDFIEVKTRKQEMNIDLWVDVTLFIAGNKEKHAILIENKAYTFPHHSKDEDGQYRCQLEVYKKKFDRKYQGNTVKKHYILITCFEEEKYINQLNEICKDYDFKVLSLTDIQQNVTTVDSGSDIFDEFWLRTW